MFEHVYAHVVATGFKNLGRSHVSMFSHPTPDGLRPSELAEELRVTKQSVNDVLRDMEALGYLTRVGDPTDGRARIIRLTAEGRRLEKVVYDGVRSAEQAIVKLLGRRGFADLHGSLEKLTTVSPLAISPRAPATNSA